MAREKLVKIPKEGVKYLKPAHNPTGELIKVICDLIIIRKQR